MRKYSVIVYFLGMLLLLLVGCRREEFHASSEQERIDTPADPEAKIVGMYVLNNGGKGNNETTLDYLDFTTSEYHRNVFAERNPQEIPTLGDNGTEIAVHKGRLYVVLNNSHRVVVLDAATTTQIGSIEVNDCRSIAFDEQYGYITSYLKPRSQANQSSLGEVIRFDLSTLAINGRVTVGRQPEQMLIVDSLILVSNSGMYNKPHFDDRISAIDQRNFVQTGYMQVGMNPHELEAWGKNYVWVSTRGNFRDCPSNIHILHRQTDEGFYTLHATLDRQCITMYNHRDTLYVLSGKESENGRTSEVKFLRFSMKSLNEIGSFITDGSEVEIQSPNGLAVHKESGHIYILDAKNYTSSGVLFCYSPDGKRLWSVRTGIQPNRIAFVRKD